MRQSRTFSQSNWPSNLPCDHIVGSKCIKKWLSLENSGANTCPLCRRQFFGPIPIREIDLNMNDVYNLEILAASAQSTEMRRLTREILAKLALRESAFNRAAQRTRPTREQALYLQLQREGARLPSLPENVPGISASKSSSMSESLAPQRADRNEVAFFEELQRIGAFNEPVGSRRRMNDDRRLVNRMRFQVHRNVGLVYCPDNHAVNGVRGGRWSMR